MVKERLDDLDRKLVSILSRDGRLSPGTIAGQTGVTGPTIRTRIKVLLEKGALRIAGLVDPFKVRGLTIALVCVTLKSHHQIDEKLDQISRLPKVNWAAVVTGRYDIMIEVVLSEETADLYRFIDQDLSQVGGINSSETFVVMNARRKWVMLPRGVKHWLNQSREETS